jgi:hypothetical protein
LEKVLAEDEQTEVSQALSLDIDQTIMGMVRIKELLAKNDLLVNALSQYRSLPCSPEKITTNRRCRLSLPASKL